MKKEPKEPLAARGFDRDNEWKNEHERRKQNWSEQDRRERKERRHPAAAELDEPLEPALARRMLS